MDTKSNDPAGSHSSESAPKSCVLTSEDMPGSSLGGKDPRKCTNADLKFWLECRKLPTKKLTTKALLVTAVERAMKSGQHHDLVDPTEDKVFVNRKRVNLKTAPSTPVPNDIVCPSLGWNKNLQDMPIFDDVSITEFTKRTSKNKSDKSCIRPEQRGYSFFAEGYIHSLAICMEDKRYFVRARCYRSQRKTSTPHKLWFCINSENSKVTKSHCSCTAGKSGYCNHILALMYEAAHLKKLGCKSVPLSGSKTDRPQEWNKPRRRGNIRCQPIMVTSVRKNVKGKRTKGSKCTLYEARSSSVIQNNNSIINNVKEQLARINPKLGFIHMASMDSASTTYVPTRLGPLVPLGSVLSYQLSITEANFDVSSIDTSLFCRSACNDNCSLSTSYPTFPLSEPDDRISPNPFLCHVIVTDAEAQKLEQDTLDQSECDLWYEERSKRLTASNFATIIKRKTNKNDKFCDNMMNKKNFSESKKMPKPLQHGRDYEDEAAERYSEYMANIKQPVQVFLSGFVVNPAFPHLGCSPDRKVIDPKFHPHFGLVEIKCPSKSCDLTPLNAAAYHQDKFSCKIEHNKLFLKQDSDHMVQVQAQMGICGAKWCDYVVYTFKGLHIQRVMFNEKMWKEKIKPAVDRFYFSHYAPYYIAKKLKQ